MLTKFTVQEAKSAVNISRSYMYDVKFLTLQGAPYIYDISRLRVNIRLLGKKLEVNKGTKMSTKKQIKQCRYNAKQRLVPVIIVLDGQQSLLHISINCIKTSNKGWFCECYF
jgi:hypothetical protein